MEPMTAELVAGEAGPLAENELMDPDHVPSSLTAGEAGPLAENELMDPDHVPSSLTGSVRRMLNELAGWP
ncbi:hypothetical protein H7I41_23100 [Mycobacterium manitobense]|uniref:Uncharacterized protein n=1 Tax=[Mycobacterium] manitobense TaxID=190147 RepID=A0A9X3BQ54_9MYCO|nr:hypothetical protein [[Mycobacterium] manitobense]